MSQRNKTLERFYDSAIIETLRYRSVFNAKVTFNQLCTYLVCTSPSRPDTLDHAAINRRLKNLVRLKKVSIKKGRYYLYGTRTVSWDLHAKYSSGYFKEAREAADILKQIKWIKMLAVTGSVAAYNAKKKDDIDFFIITEENRLWLTRFFVVLFLKMSGKYRTDKNFHKKICPNIYISEDTLEWERSRQNIYSAHEVLLMHPLIDRDDMYFKFIKKNKWALEYFPFFEITLPKKTKDSTKYQSSIVDLLEYAAMSFQLWYMRKRKTSEIVSNNFIHFNKVDHSEKVLKELEARK